MLKKIIIISFIIIFATGCEENEIPVADDKNSAIENFRDDKNPSTNNIRDKKYPTTYKRFSDEELSIMRNEYSQRNPYMYTTLNNFGFCCFGLPPAHNPINPNPVRGEESISKVKDLILKNTNETGINSIDNFGFCSLGDIAAHKTINTKPVSSEEAIGKVKEFILKNMNETGITSIDNIVFKKINDFSSDSKNISHWYLTVKEQTVDTIEVLYSTVSFRVNNGEVVECKNNWYPEIYIPKVFNFDIEETKPMLVNKIITHLGHTGEYYVTIKQENIDESEVRLVIYPFWSDEKIELRVTWEINVPSPVYCKIYIDVMTGAIIAEEPTIVA